MRLRFMKKVNTMALHDIDSMYTGEISPSPHVIGNFESILFFFFLAPYYEKSFINKGKEVKSHLAFS